MEEIKINEDNVITYYKTEWNDRVLGFKTNEISEIKFDSIEKGNELLSLFDKEAKLNNIIYSAIRINSDSKDLKFILEKSNYFNIETSIRVEFNLKRFEENSFLEKFKISIEKSTIEDLKIIKNISNNEFNHGRFFEDPSFNRSISKQRNLNWIDDLYEKSNLLIGKNKQNICAFMFYKTTNSVVNFEMGGVDSKYSHLAYSFWYNIIKKMKEDGITNINTLVSGTNLGVINLYSKFGFRFSNTLFGYRKIRR